MSPFAAGLSADPGSWQGRWYVLVSSSVGALASGPSPAGVSGDCFGTSAPRGLPCCVPCLGLPR